MAKIEQHEYECSPYILAQGIQKSVDYILHIMRTSPVSIQSIETDFVKAYLKDDFSGTIVIEITKTIWDG